MARQPRQIEGHPIDSGDKLKGSEIEGRSFFLDTVEQPSPCLMPSNEVIPDAVPPVPVGGGQAIEGRQVVAPLGVDLPVGFVPCNIRDAITDLICPLLS